MRGGQKVGHPRPPPSFSQIQGCSQTASGAGSEAWAIDPGRRGGETDFDQLRPQRVVHDLRRADARRVRAVTGHVTTRFWAGHPRGGSGEPSPAAMGRA